VEPLLKILHLEDNQKDMELARETLAEEGIEYEPIFAADREEFAAALAEGGFDLIISDYSLPSFDGLTALTMTREAYPDIPFIFLSGVLGEDRAIESLKSGATDYVMKSKLTRLAPAVRRALNYKEVQLARRAADDLLLREKERFHALSVEFQTLLDAIPDMISIRDPDFKIIWANKATAAGMDREERDVIGQLCYEIRHNSHEPCDSCPAAESFRTGKAAATVTKWPDNSIWEIRTIPTIEAERVVSVIEICRDITEHRRLEDQYFQSQKLETVGTLASGIAHDFNNILTCIAGYGEIILMNLAEDSPQRPFVKIILEAANRAASLTRDLLMFSRKQPCEQKPVDLNAVIKDAEKFFNQVIPENIVTVIKLYEGVLQVSADRNQLEQVLLNLATNARDAMAKYEQGTFTITTERVSLTENDPNAPPGVYALITVTDTGEGMTNSTRQRVFEPFFTTKDVGKGSGLGLAACYGIIKQHGGEICLTSEPGTGTAFMIYLPLIAAQPSKKPIADRVEIISGGTETILLAEDDGLLRKMTKTLLTEYGYAVIETVNGAEAVNAFLGNRDNIDLLLFDLIMPQMNGNEACTEIRKIRPGMKAIITSGYAPEAEREKTLLENGMHLVTKPLKPAELLQKVRSLLDEAES